MQNDEYLDMLRVDWQKMLGLPKVEVTPEEQAELRRLLKEQEEAK